MKIIKHCSLLLFLTLLVGFQAHAAIVISADPSNIQISSGNSFFIDVSSLFEQASKKTSSPTEILLGETETTPKSSGNSTEELIGPVQQILMPSSATAQPMLLSAPQPTSQFPTAGPGITQAAIPLPSTLVASLLGIALLIGKRRTG